MHIRTLAAVPFALAAFSAGSVVADSLVDYEAAEAAYQEEQSAAPKSAADAMEAIAANDPSIDVTHNAEGDVDGMVMLSDVLFAYGEYGLASDALLTLEGIAQKLDGIAGLEVIGHTDSRGSEAFNLALGQSRAEAVMDWLVESGYDFAKGITASSAGESTPIAANRTETGADNPEGRALNRRVEFKIIEQAQADPVDLAAADVTGPVATTVE